MEDATKASLPSKADFKNMGVGGSIVAALIFLTPVKEWFYTREEGTALSKSVSEIKELIVSESKESTRVMERKTDKILERLKETELRVQHDVDRDNDLQNARIQTIEAVVLKTSASKRIAN